MIHALANAFFMVVLAVSLAVVYVELEENGSAILDALFGRR
jgi:hypothetical protein